MSYGDREYRTRIQRQMEEEQARVETRAARMVLAAGTICVMLIMVPFLLMAARMEGLL